MSSRLSIGIAAIIFLLAVGFFGATLVHALWYAPEATGPAVTSAGKGAGAATSSLPVRLVIPALHIDAAVQYVGITAAGNMGVPSNFTDVAWYQGSSVPGQVGSAVIDGHVDNGLGLDGVFKHLADIKAGDEIDVLDRGGKTLRFVVQKTEVYPYQQVPGDLLFTQHDQARLNLVTCEGSWVAGDRTYDHRLVVFATLQ